MNRALALTVLLAAAPAVADDLAFSDVKADALPAQAKVRGKVVERIVKFTDKLGDNYVVFSSTSTEKPPTAMGASLTRWLFVDHWAIAKGKARSLLPARDFEKDCELGLTAQFVGKAFHVTDLDADGIAEVTYGYQLACRSDVRPATYKLLVVENGTKHILRGEATFIIPDESPMGGTFTPEPVEKKWGAKLYAHAVAVWKATSRDVENQ